MEKNKDLFSIVLDILRFSCGVHGCLDPTKISIPELIVDIDDFQIPVPDAFELLDDVLDAHISFGDCNPLGVQKHESLSRNITSTFSPRQTNVIEFHTANAAARPEPYVKAFPPFDRVQRVTRGSNVRGRGSIKRVVRTRIFPRTFSNLVLTS